MVREDAYLHSYSKKECITIEKEWINNPREDGFFNLLKLTIAIRDSCIAAGVFQ